MSVRYTTRPRVPKLTDEEESDPSLTATSLVETIDEPQFTGLYDILGNALYREVGRAPMGFRLRARR